MRNALRCKALRMERERGLEPPTLCLGIRSGPGPSPSTCVRQRIFDRVWRRFDGSLDIRNYPSPSIRLATVWLQCLRPVSEVRVRSASSLDETLRPIPGRTWL